jgi:hypothetical protein
MTGLVRDRLTTAQRVEVFSFPPGAGAVIFKGGNTGIDAAGNAWPAGNANVVLVVGRAETGTGDISPSPTLTTGQLPGGIVTAQGTGLIEVLRGWAFAWDNSTGADLIGAGNFGQTVYAVDDHTVALTSSGGTRLPAGTCRGLTAGGQVLVQTL